ncbi:ComF family protein [Soonwooa sp.]|uniref:ComF family protein n=1 Tax=Soonwooa sp. TaxID=1938592 RepID=UPI0028A803D7|nr:ComF family protein [Soonwooa sp.]
MFLDLFFPNRCLACEEIISANAILCDICEEKLSFSHFKFDCENPLAQKAKLLFPIEQAYALFIFKEENLARNLLHRLKYGDQEFIGKHFSHWIFDRISITNIDEIVSVPLHPKKLKKRGYNQLTLLGNELSKLYNIPINHQLLKRNSHNKAQAQKDKQQRTETETLFSVIGNPENKHILLIDDVYTTGNTLASIAWEILKHPNTKVSILVVAMD